MISLSKFHERLNELKNACGETQVKIAEGLKITPQALSYYLKGREPNYDLLIKLAQYFNCTTDYLLGLSDIKNQEQITNSNKFADDLAKSLATVPEKYHCNTKGSIMRFVNIWNDKHLSHEVKYWYCFGIIHFINSLRLMVSSLQCIDLSTKKIILEGKQLNYEEINHYITSAVAEILAAKTKNQREINTVPDVILILILAKLNETLGSRGIEIKFIKTIEDLYKELPLPNIEDIEKGDPDA